MEREREREEERERERERKRERERENDWAEREGGGREDCDYSSRDVSVF